MTDTSRVLDLDNLPDDAWISINELSFLANRSRTSLWRDVKAGRLIKPIATGPQSRRWRVADVRKYLRGKGTRS